MLVRMVGQQLTWKAIRSLNEQEGRRGESLREIGARSLVDSSPVVFSPLDEGYEQLKMEVEQPLSSPLTSLSSQESSSELQGESNA